MCPIGFKYQNEPIIKMPNMRGYMKNIFNSPKLAKKNMIWISLNRACPDCGCYIPKYNRVCPQCGCNVKCDNGKVAKLKQCS